MILGTKVRIFIRFRLVAAYFYSFTPLSQSSEVGYIPVLAYLCLRPCLLEPAPVLADIPVFKAALLSPCSVSNLDTNRIFSKNFFEKIKKCFSFAKSNLRE